MQLIALEKTNDSNDYASYDSIHVNDTNKNNASNGIRNKSILIDNIL